MQTIFHTTFSLPLLRRASLITLPHYIPVKEWIQVDLRFKAYQTKIERNAYSLLPFLSHSPRPFRLTLWSEILSYLSYGQGKQAENVLWDFNRKEKSHKTFPGTLLEAFHHKNRLQHWRIAKRTWVIHHSFDNGVFYMWIMPVFHTQLFLPPYLPVPAKQFSEAIFQKT